MTEEEKAIQFYKKFIEAEEQELEWMYKEDEEYYRDSIEQKELLIKGWRNILNLINKLQKANEEKDKTIKIRLDYEEAYAKLRKQYEELMSTNIIKNEEIKQKDKQIDLMAKYIDEIDVSEDICEGKTICDENCKYCIKQYFETKAKKGE